MRSHIFLLENLYLYIDALPCQITDIVQAYLIDDIVFLVFRRTDYFLGFY